MKSIGNKAASSLPPIVYEDEHLAVFEKPAGLTVESPYGKEGTLLGALELLRPDLSRGGLVHRLDRGTSGLLVVAKTAEVMKGLRSLFKERDVTKEYLALVSGKTPSRFEVDSPVRRSAGRRSQGRGAMRADYRGKVAMTRGERIRYFPKRDLSLLRIRILTGRRHQIRAHLAFIGHPIIGDPDYGGSPELPRPFLHASRLAFRHPVTGHEIDVSSPLPPDLSEHLRLLD